MKPFKQTVIFVALAVAVSLTPSITQAQPAPTVQSTATSISSTGNAIVSKPAGTQPGDLLVASLAVEKGSDATITPPAGWAFIVRTNNGTDGGLAAFYKIASAAEPATYQFTLTGQKWSAGVTRITGYSTAAPINVSAGRTGSGGNVIAPTVTTTADNALVLAFYSNKKAASYTAALTTTERFDAPNGPGGGPSHMLADFVQILPNATGTRTAVPTETDKWCALQIAIAPNDGFPAAGSLALKLIDSEQREVSYQGLPDLNYAIEYTDELLDLGTQWTLLEQKFAGISGRVIVVDDANVSARFYRAVLLP